MKKIRITSRRSYKIEYVSSFKDKLQIGEWCEETKTIRILKGMSKRRTRAVLFHELIHAIEHEYGFSMNHENLAVLAEGLERIFRLNNFKP